MKAVEQSYSGRNILYWRKSCTKALNIEKIFHPKASPIATGCPIKCLSCKCEAWQIGHPIFQTDNSCFDDPSFTSWCGMYKEAPDCSRWLSSYDKDENQSFFKRDLYSYCDGWSLDQQANCVPITNSWVSDRTSVISKRDYINTIYIRLNCLYIKSRASRGWNVDHASIFRSI